MTTMITGSQINWQRCQVLVTGGASFIGSHLVERLIQKGASVRVADNLSSGRLENLDAVQSKIEFLKGDLLEPDFAIKSSQGCKVVFHLAADHGGGGILLPILPTASTTWPRQHSIPQCCCKWRRENHLREFGLCLPHGHPDRQGALARGYGLLHATRRYVR